jgi:hypothetical protein
LKLTIYLRLQDCSSKDRRAFVAKGKHEHGIANGAVRWYEIEADSWKRARGILKTFDVMGYTGLTEKTAEWFSQDIGTARNHLRRIPLSEVRRQLTRLEHPELHYELFLVCKDGERVYVDSFSNLEAATKARADRKLYAILPVRK